MDGEVPRLIKSNSLNNLQNGGAAAEQDPFYRKRNYETIADKIQDYQQQYGLKNKKTKLKSIIKNYGYRSPPPRNENNSVIMRNKYG